MKITFEATLSVADLHRHIPHIFEVPPGTTQIHVEFSYSPRYSQGQENHNQMSLSIADPAGPRGVYYLIRDYGINITEARCTPGFNAGPVRPGQWNVEVDTYRLLPPDPITYTIEVTLSSDPIPDPIQTYEKKQIASRGPGWYRGDLHAHSLHSDASWDVPDLVQYARDHKLDFITLTDHNTVSGLPQVESLAGDDLLTMGGMELTTYYGHAVVLGTRKWFEWRLDTDDHFTMPQLADRVLASGALFVTAHPMAPGDPECSGCHWEYEDMLPGNSPAVEIWNGGWSPYNQMTVEMYYQWLNEGHKISATAGSDMHGPPDPDRRGGRNVVYAEELSEEAILEAVRKGRSYISAGPDLILSGQTQSGIEAINGDTLPPEAAVISVHWSGAHEGDILRFNVNGRTLEKRPIQAAGEASWTLEPGQAKWCNVEIRDAQNEMWAITNPIYFGDR